MSAILTHEGSSEEQLLNNLGSNLNLTDEELQVYPPPSSYPLKTYDDYSMVNDPVSKQAQTVAELPEDLQIHCKENLHEEITKGVLRKKLSKMRHLCVTQAIKPEYLDSIMPEIIRLFHPQQVQYNGGVANVKAWKISTYLEVMPGGVPCTNPCLPLLDLCVPLLDCVDAMFTHWYKQQHACNKPGQPKRTEPYKVKRVMNFITRYTAHPKEQALLKHVDGAGKVSGSAVLALPIDKWTGPESIMSFEGHGGGVRFWDGSAVPSKQTEVHYPTRSGDVAFIDRAVWHQADPITKGTRWAMVIFYDVE
ncbi:hypothetical protein TrST_g9765 [Triparma strigata]|uniref:Uncharacterized protein n=1 Tax=Triparma strigata TaxID=1606541 RepID=A0A9W6ZIJ7_9STRA|nr:hypothetical protein TrST_g9765 [Triparma strigata]